MTKKHLKKLEPSYNGLPSQWTTGYTSDVAYQMTNKHVNYNKRLASVHKYHDNTKNLMRKSLKHK